MSLLVPAKTSTDVVDKPSRVATLAANSKLVQDTLFALSLDIVHTSPAEAAAHIKTEAAKWDQLVKDANIKVDRARPGPIVPLSVGEQSPGFLRRPDVLPSK